MERTRISPDTWLYELKVIHTYAASGTYSISFREFYRSDGTLNMDNAVQMPFYVETFLVLDPYLGFNSSPTFTRPPAIDQGIQGLTYHHQPGAVDADGDSLSYRLLPSRQDRTLPVANFRYPHLTFPAGDSRNGTTETGEASFFRVNPLSGDIVWDTPGTSGWYNFAFMVEEWRKVDGQYHRIGAVTRDMQIIVAPDVETPELQFPISDASLSPAPGETLEWVVSATALNPSDSLVLEIWGDFADRSGASLSARQVRTVGEASISIRWTGEEDRGQHYQLIAKAYNPQDPYAARIRAAYLYQDLSGPLGIAENIHSLLQVYPNPLKGTDFHLSLPEARGQALLIHIFDTQGRQVLQQNTLATEKQHRLSLPQAKPGIYLIHVYLEGRMYRSKLIVQ
jgi:hypothetical protein